MDCILLLQSISVLSINISPLAMFFLNMVLILTIISVSYAASMEKHCIFSMLVCAVWMLVEIATSIVRELAGMDGRELQTARTVISLMLMFFLVVIAVHYAKRMD